jgi:hypothetical protein
MATADLIEIAIILLACLSVPVGAWMIGKNLYRKVVLSVSIIVNLSFLFLVSLGCDFGNPEVCFTKPLYYIGIAGLMGMYLSAKSKNFIGPITNTMAFVLFSTPLLITIVVLTLVSYQT